MARKLTTGKNLRRILERNTGLDVSPKGKVRGIGEAVSEGLQDFVAPASWGLKLALGGYLSKMMPKISKIAFFSKVMSGHGLEGKLRKTYQKQVKATPKFGAKLAQAIKRAPKEFFEEGLSLKDIRISPSKNFQPGVLGYYMPETTTPMGLGSVPNHPYINIAYENSTRTPLLSGKRSILSNLIHETFGHHVEAQARNEAFGVASSPKFLSKGAQRNLRDVLSDPYWRRLTRPAITSPRAEEFAESMSHLFRPEAQGVGFRGVTGGSAGEYIVTDRGIKDARKVLITLNEKRLKRFLLGVSRDQQKGIKPNPVHKKFIKRMWEENLSDQEKAELVKIGAPKAVRSLKEALKRRK